MVDWFVQLRKIADVFYNNLKQKFIGSQSPITLIEADTHYRPPWRLAILSHVACRHGYQLAWCFWSHFLCIFSCKTREVYPDWLWFSAGKVTPKGSEFSKGMDRSPWPKNSGFSDLFHKLPRMKGSLHNTFQQKFIQPMANLFNLWASHRRKNLVKL